MLYEVPGDAPTRLLYEITVEELSKRFVTVDELWERVLERMTREHPEVWEQLLMDLAEARLTSEFEKEIERRKSSQTDLLGQPETPTSKEDEGETRPHED